MKTATLHLTTLLACLLAPAGAGAAFDAKIVPADSRWVVYVDLNTLRETVLGKELLAMIPKVEVPAPEAGIRPDFQKILQTVGTATAFGSNFSKKHAELDGTVVIQGTADLPKIVDGLLAQMSLTNPEKVTDVKDLPFTAYQSKDGLVVALPPEPIVVISKSRARLTAALEVYRGKAPSLVAGKSPLAAQLPGPGQPFLFAASVVPSGENLVPQDGPQARILQLAEAGSLAVGEEGPQTAARLQLKASSTDVADKLMKIVQGVTAMISLTETTDQRLTEFINSVKTERDGNVVKLSLAYPTERIIQMIQNARSKPVAWEEPRTPVPGQVIATWKADQNLDNVAAGPNNLLTKKIENVHLVRGATITLVGRRDQGENARFDCVAIAPLDGSAAPLKFEAEDMRLSRYRVENAPFASGGKLIIINADTGNARFQFPGADGDYALTVSYVDESDGEATFYVSVANPAAPTTNPAPAAKPEPAKADH